MKDLIKKVLREQFEDPNVRGCNFFNNNNDIEFCKVSENNFRKKEYKNIVFNELEKLKKDLQSGVYEDLKDRIKSYQENDPFFENNEKQVNILISHLSASCPSSIVKIKEKRALDSNKTLFVYQEKIEDKLESKYSSLNKLNTNYQALAYLITRYRQSKSNDYKSSHGFVEIFNDFFKGKEISIGESPFYNLILNYFRKKINDIDFETIKNIHKTIKKTTELGSKSEEQFRELLDDVDAEYIFFSGDFSWVDFMGVDLIWKANDVWFPVQIKTDINACFGNSIFCKNFCVGKNFIQYNNYKKWDNTWTVNEYIGNMLKKQHTLPLK